MNVIREVRKLRWGLRWRAAVKGLVILAAVAASALILALAADPWLGDAHWLRTFLVLAFWAALIYVLVRWLLIPVIRVPGAREIFDRVEREDPYFQNRVSTAYYLLRHPGEAERLGFSPALMRHTLRWVGKLQPETVFHTLSRDGETARIVRLAFIPILLLFMILVVRPQPAMEIWFRYLAAPEEDGFVLLPPEVDITGDLEVPRNSPAEVGVLVLDAPRAPWVHLEGKPGIWTGLPAQELGGGLYLARIASVDRTMRYRASVDGIFSRVGTIAPVDPPELTAIRWRIVPPAYTRLAEVNAETRVGSIEFLAGSVINADFRASVPLSSMTLEGPEGTARQLPLDHDRLGGSTVLAPTQSVDLRVRMTGRLGLSALSEPIRLEVVQDEAPRVRIATPEVTANIPDSQRVAVAAEVRDDYGLATAELHYDLNYAGKEKVVPFFDSPLPSPPEGFDFALAAGPADASPKTVSGAILWDLAPLELLPGDEVTYYLVAYDNDTVSGPKEGRSEVHFLRFPSMYEIYESVEKAEAAQVDSLRDVIERQRELRENIEDAAEKLREDVFLPAQRERKPRWEEQARLEEAAGEQEEIARELERVAREVQETSEALKQKAETSLRTLEKMERVRELFNELLTEEMKAVIREFQQALNQFQQQRGPEPLNQLEFSMEQFEQQLDSLLKLLENTYMERQLEAAVEEMRQLLASQDEVRRRTEQAAEQEGLSPEGLSPEELEEQSERLSGQEDAIRERTGELARRLEELAQELARQGEEGAERLQQLAQQLREGALPENLRQAVEELSRGGFQNAIAPEQSARESMAAALQSLSELSAMMGGAGFDQDIAALLDLLHRSQYLSERQEEVQTGFETISGAGAWGSPDRKRDLSRQEGILAIESRRLKDAFIEFAGESPFRDFSVAVLFEDAATEMSAAAAGSKDQSPLEVRARARAALGHVNEATKKLLESFCSACQAAQSLGLEGYFQKLSELIKRQQNLNFDTVRLDGTNREQASWEQELNRILQEQQAIRRELGELEKLREKLRRQEELLGDLQQVGEDMGKIEKDLQDRITDDRVQEKQDQVLTRLLDAEKSQREQDLTRERESEVAREGPMPSPPSRDHSAEVERKATQPGSRLTDDEILPRYRSRVRAYFRRLSSEVF